MEMECHRKGHSFYKVGFKKNWWQHYFAIVSLCHELVKFHQGAALGAAALEALTKAPRVCLDLKFAWPEISRKEKEELLTQPGVSVVCVRNMVALTLCPLISCMPLASAWFLGAVAGQCSAYEMNTGRQCWLCISKWPFSNQPGWGVNMAMLLWGPWAVVHHVQQVQKNMLPRGSCGPFSLHHLSHPYRCVKMPFKRSGLGI